MCISTPGLPREGVAKQPPSCTICILSSVGPGQQVLWTVEMEL